ncbi:hypothetical protein E2562_039333 [Oryza meyeriana var. granulata]|uniref:Uncharacterized protein n=1 Tax=Oryza meyeriana var. granulata TaxID=110450 RepID=A0A6G1CXZ3_9ORYZ|nr:hypothetical protein E2562_039333 [Oryza meyeriana var. granulata]
MASSSSAPAIPASLSIPVSEKLTRENYLLWRAQVLPAIRAAQLEGFLDGSESEPPKTLTVDKDSKKMEVANPDYVTWRVRDQHVLTYLVTSLSREKLIEMRVQSTKTNFGRSRYKQIGRGKWPHWKERKDDEAPPPPQIHHSGGSYEENCDGLGNAGGGTWRASGCNCWQSRISGRRMAPAALIGPKMSGYKVEELLKQVIIHKRARCLLRWS